MRRLSLALLVLAACSGPSRPVDDPQPPAPAPDATPTPAPTAAQRALEAHGEALLDQRGVVFVRVDDAGDGLIVDVCAPEVSVDATGIDVPVAVVPGDWERTTRGEPCGCVAAGAYHDAGETVMRECNQCVCRDRGFVCPLVACAIQIVDRIFFDRDAAVVRPNSVPVLDAVAEALIAHPQLKVTIRGHAAPKEKQGKKLSLKRATAVRDYLVKAGVPAAQLLGVEGVGAEQPMGEIVDAERNVEFVVAL